MSCNNKEQFFNTNKHKLHTNFHKSIRVNLCAIRDNLCLFFLKFLIIILLFSSNSFADEQFKYDPKGSRDPFVPLISEEGGLVSDAYSIAAFGEVRLEGIVWDDSGPSMALINGELVEEGDMLGEAKVLKIEKDSVKLDIGGEEVVIRLSSE